MPSVNNLRPGSSVIDRIFFGDTEVSAAYLGDTLLYHVQDESSSSSEPPYKRRLEYLQSSGTQYIDTGVGVDSSNGFELMFQIVRFRNSDMFGGGPSYDTGLGLYTRDTGILGFICGTTCTDSINYTDGNSHTLSIKQNVFYSDGSVVGSSSTYASYPLIHMLIFRHSCSASYGDPIIEYKVFYCKLYDENLALIRDFIPVMDNNDVPCMYDRVTRQLYYNSGTGSFLYGEKNIWMVNGYGSAHIDWYTYYENNGEAVKYTYVSGTLLPNASTQSFESTSASYYYSYNGMSAIIGLRLRFDSSDSTRYLERYNEPGYAGPDILYMGEYSTRNSSEFSCPAHFEYSYYAGGYTLHNVIDVVYT